ncbi:GNAT family N-acetyltransferase [Actinomadura scrupuli]|uniref:GNAT family N-acetyltransferase n=1 Tax=Actinomadura scrupuli TaxID=559629 RepID=UPI003D97528A
MDDPTVRPRPQAVIRPYRAEDLPEVYDVCVRTAHEGGDARGIYRDPDLMPDIFAGPYLRLEPRLAFVLDDGERVVGYVIGTADTAAFAAAYRRLWLPEVGGRYPRAQAPATPDEQMIELMYTPERMVLPELADYPAHLHIDLLPRYQRAGHGRALMATLLAALREAGAPRVHLGMVTANRGARLFYDRLGFRELPVTDPGPLTYLGRSTDPLR